MFSSDHNSTFLFASSSAGWDGAPVNNYFIYESFNSRSFPRTPTTNTQALGVMVLRNVNGSYLFHQFIRCKSPIPFGTVGVDMAIAGDSVGTLVLTVRDRIPNQNPQHAYSHPAVITYRYNTQLDLFVEDTRFETAVNWRGEPFHYRDEDWFGVGMTAHALPNRQRRIVEKISVDPKTGDEIRGAVVEETQGDELRYVLTVGAPWEGEGVYVFSTNVSQSDPPSPPTNLTRLNTSTPESTLSWTRTQFLANNYDTLPTYFGGKQATTRSGRFLIIADPTSKSGRGSLQLYHRRDEFEDLFGYEDVVRVAMNNISIPIYWDRVGQLSKGVDTYAQHRSWLYFADHYGVGLAANEQLVVVGAPVEGCVYSFGLPTPCESFYYLFY
jgi:hypothetical protein